MSGPQDPNRPESPDPNDPNQQPGQYPPPGSYPPPGAYPPAGGGQYPPTGGQPAYPSQGYPSDRYPQGEPQDPGYAYPPAGAPVPTASRPNLLAAFTDRAERRPEPRLGVSFAGAGIGLMIAGIIVWGGDYAFSDTESALGGGGSSHRFLGAFLALVVVVAGYVLAIRAKRGPLATAGVVASAIGIPVTLGFLTLGESDGGTPFSFDAVVLVSVIAWLISYLAVPGARGHSFLLAASGVLFWIYILDKVEPQVFGVAFFLPTITVNGTSLFRAPDFTTVAAVSLVIGLVYYAAAYALDRRGKHGTATALVVSAIPATSVGVALLSRDLKQIGTGILAVVIGVAVALYGSKYGRRYTTWTSTSSAAFGLLLIIVKIVGDNAAAGGIVLIVVGAAVVAGGAAVARTLGEPDDMEQVATTMPRATL